MVLGKIIATRGQILRLKYTKFYFGWVSAPDTTGRAYSAPRHTLAGFKGLLLRGGMGKEGKGTGKEGKEGKGKRGEEIGWEGRKGRKRELRDRRKCRPTVPPRPTFEQFNHWEQSDTTDNVHGPIDCQ